MHLKVRSLYLLPTLLIVMFTHASAQQKDQTPDWRDILKQPSEWYGSKEAVRIADNVLLYQHENGGWGKNIDMTPKLDKAAQAKVQKETKTIQTTIDNGATITQVTYLGRVYQATKHERFKQHFLRGLDYLLDAQYKNGGWPQYYPIRKGYYQHITYNDGAMIGVMTLLRDVAQEKAPYSFVDPARQQRAKTAIQKGLEIILKTQIVVDGTLTAWCAQHDSETLEPAKARAYELPSISGGESAGITRYLMEIDNPDDRVIQAVESAIAWYKKSKVTGWALQTKKDPALAKGYDRVLVKAPNAPPLWARFYEIETNRPIYVGRDGVIKYSLAEIEYERRVGYSYIRDYGSKLLASYPAWKKKWNSK